MLARMPPRKDPRSLYRPQVTKTLIPGICEVHQTVCGSSSATRQYDNAAACESRHNYINYIPFYLIPILLHIAPPKYAVALHQGTCHPNHWQARAALARKEVAGVLMPRPAAPA
jgi:hypothetical protein